uniref:very-long-chain (3R)-3-hydroxyacyl-CoA dehydratase n=1 Tax=Euplotes harpa TaxID=151035 RepID=A0A7S3NE49_9SPIT|mmetsp:Transcript_36201/g.41751  ORF Transcript_36201/g.41751 Transcript_36201/m.41751 type:complete len:189 (+) Transcript_36201:149-715(+)
MKYPGLIENLVIVQLLQYLDIFFGVAGVTKTNIPFSFMQITARNFVVLAVFQHNLASTYPVIAVIPWCIAELIRYPYYIVTDNTMLSVFVPFLKWLRLSGFIVLYPIGASGELLSLYDSWDILVSKRPYSIDLPNQFNFAFDIVYMYYCFFIFMPIGLYFIYTSLLRARKKAFSKQTEDKAELKSKRD